MDEKMLGLALQNVNGAWDSFLKSEDASIKNTEARRQAEQSAMNLALRNSTYELEPVKMALDLMRSLPVRDERRINRELSLAVDPFSRIDGIQAPSSGGSIVDEARRLIQKATTPSGGIDFNIPSVGVGANMINQGFSSGSIVPQGANIKNLSPQERSIEKLRGGGRSPQSVDSLVQPLEGDSSPYQNMPGATNLEPQVIMGDPNVEKALNHIDGQFAMSPYSALRNPEMRALMIDSMLRQGFINGLGIQTDSTGEALKSLQNTQFMAAQKAAQMNQKAQEVTAKSEIDQRKMEIDLLERAALIAGQNNNKEDQRRYDAKVAELKAMVDVLKSKDNVNRPRAPRAGSSKEDPNKKDYRNQLNEAQDQIRKSVDAQIAAFGGVVGPEKRARIIKDTVAKDPSIAQLIAGLRAKAKTWPDVANNYSQLFEMVGQPLGGASTSAAPSGPAAGSAAARAKALLDARKKK